MKVGITGQAGFVGTHLYNYLSLEPDLFELVPFEDRFFEESHSLNKWVELCDVIVHLAAVNRHSNPEVIYKTNLNLVRQLIASLEATGSYPHVLFSSSIQEEMDNPYGRSKREGRELLSSWADKTGAYFTGLVIPNVFGPFGNPYYNSVVSTFCHQLTHNEDTVIETDGELRLIYINELALYIRNAILEKKTNPELSIPFTSEIKVSQLLALVQKYKSDYMENGVIPDLGSAFEINLFNTFRSYINLKEHYPVALKVNSDNRGSFVETIRLGIGGQVSFSTTHSGITRGNHFHIRKIERFIVLKGEAIIQLRKKGTQDILEFHLLGSAPSFVDMPIWYTHNIKNVGNEDLYTQFWINEFFSSEDPDTYFEEV